MLQLVPVEKNGEYIEVHPDILKQHQELGWKVCARRAPKEEQKPDYTKLNVDQMKEKLTALKIEFAADAKKEDLLKLLESAEK